MFSVVVPAYNEAASIRETLKPLVQIADQLGGQIVVVANGCHDETADIAREFKRVELIETPVASKSNALNLGDQACSQFPRLFMDGDLRIDPEQFQALVQRLQTTSRLMVTPQMVVNTSYSTVWVQRFYAFWTRLPAYQVRSGGLFGVTQAGRARFEEFPELTADDSFVRSRFAEDEVEVAKDIHFSAMAPSNLGGLVAVRKRVKRGNRVLSTRNTTGLGVPQNSARSILAQCVRSPNQFLNGLVFAGVTAWVALSLKLENKNNSANQWERDEGSRISVNTSKSS